MKRLIVLLLGIGVLIGITGCGNEDKKEIKKKILKVALWDANQKPIVENIIEDFEKRNPNINVIVEITPFSQYWTKLETSATGGQLQDIFWINAPNFKKYASANMILPIQNLVDNKSINIEELPKGMIKMYSYNGELLASPKDIDTTALWYNKEIFKKYNISEPNDNWTWEDMINTSKEIKAKSGMYGLALSYEGQEDYYEIISQFGGEVISTDKKTSGFNNPNTIDAIKEIKNLISEGVIPGLGEVSDTRASDLFQSQKVAMTYSGSWMIKPYMNNELIKDKINLVKLPLKNKDAAIIHGLGYAIYSKTKYPEEAKKLIVHLSSKEAHDIQAESGVVIPANIKSQKIWLKSYENLNLKGYGDMNPKGIEYPASLMTAKWEDIQKEYLNKVWIGEMSPEEACSIINEKMNKILLEEKN
ncbi:sugar ABC transporter substrate-binding protein [uncultured Cetobacterium sp.]|uniref:ABC transporter substrate-binding protein n=1 Tax=uncultured Cetobacterium sp. TaxID=527638 RepID=UPI0026180370|nr:sugar ABC transporter substrate-binding protein [uncultured Cetobacterium sp.]